MSRRSFMTLIALGALPVSGCGEAADKLFCGSEGCGLTDERWESLSALANLPEAPPPDRSNRMVGNPDAQKLGHKWFFEPRFAGPSLQLDSLKRPVDYGRVAKGQPTNVSCASCHSTTHGSIDVESMPGNVSVGASWSETNSTPIHNSAYYPVQFWSGRADSVWAQAAGSSEAGSYNGNRLRTAWLLQDLYRDEYNALFPDAPLPLDGTSADWKAIVESDGPRAGQCKLNPGCPTMLGCRDVQDDSGGGGTGCFPRFPLQGKPGATAGCQPGDPKEPFGDAYDCMDPMDQESMVQMMVHFGKTIAAYEFMLVSRDSVFDRYVNKVHEGVADEQAAAMTGFSSAALRGAKLFAGKAACVECHNTSLFSDSKFHNVGVPQAGPGIPTEADCPAGGVCDCVGTADHGPNNCLPWGARDGLAKLKKNPYRRDSRFSDDPNDDSRKLYYSIPFAPGGGPAPPGFEVDADGAVRKGAYRTPTLRDVALTAPYMHNGLFTTLEQVVAHYNRGGSPSTVGTASPPIKPLHLTDEEQSDLVEFLKSLTGAPLPSSITETPALPK
jgi:cytochrome c peroxidase